MRYAAHVGECIQGLNGNTSRKETAWKLHSWDESIQMDLREMGWKGVDWIRDRVHDRDQ
jgi:hypothetical protein